MTDFHTASELARVIGELDNVRERCDRLSLQLVSSSTGTPLDVAPTLARPVSFTTYLITGFNCMARNVPFLSVQSGAAPKLHGTTGPL